MDFDSEIMRGVPVVGWRGGGDVGVNWIFPVGFNLCCSGSASWWFIDVFVDTTYTAWFQSFLRHLDILYKCPVFGNLRRMKFIVWFNIPVWLGVRIGSCVALCLWCGINPCQWRWWAIPCRSVAHIRPSIPCVLPLAFSTLIPARENRYFGFGSLFQTVKTPSLSTTSVLK